MSVGSAYSNDFAFAWTNLWESPLVIYALSNHKIGKDYLEV